MTGQAHAPASFEDEFYDFETSVAFCSRGAAAAADSGTKTGREVRCLEKIAGLVPWSAGAEAVTLVDLGAGGGRKALVLLAAIRENSTRPVTYLPVDGSPYCGSLAIAVVLEDVSGLSPDLVSKLCGEQGFELGIDPSPHDVAVLMAESKGRSAASTLVQSYLTVARKNIQIDFFADISSVAVAVRAHCRGATCVTMFLLLGQTLGNCSSDERRRFLRGLAAAMVPGDLLVIDAGLRPEEGGAAEYAERVANLETAYRVEALEFMVHKADQSDSTFAVAYVPSTNRVEHWFARPDGSAQTLGFSSLFSQAQVLEELSIAGLTPRWTVSSLDLDDLAPGPECVVVIAERT